MYPDVVERNRRLTLKVHVVDEVRLASCLQQERRWILAIAHDQSVGMLEIVVGGGELVGLLGSPTVALIIG